MQRHMVVHNSDCSPSLAPLPGVQHGFVEENMITLPGTFVDTNALNFPNSNVADVRELNPNSSYFNQYTKN